MTNSNWWSCRTTILHVSAGRCTMHMLAAKHSCINATHMCNEKSPRGLPSIVDSSIGTINGKSCACWCKSPCNATMHWKHAASLQFGPFCWEGIGGQTSLDPGHHPCISTAQQKSPASRHWEVTVLQQGNSSSSLHALEKLIPGKCSSLHALVDLIPGKAMKTHQRRFAQLKRHIALKTVPVTVFKDGRRGC